jgi:hypothetical protein
MKITVYLPDELVGSLDRLARERYLQRQQAGAWPQRVRGWDGDPDFPALESPRGAEQSAGGGPFESGLR